MASLAKEQKGQDSMCFGEFQTCPVFSGAKSLHSKRRRRWDGVKDSTLNRHHDPKCPSARRLHMVRENKGPLVKVLPVPGWWPMKLLAVRVHFLRCGCLLNDLSVECVLSLVFK
ncbi:hypothetical protein TNCV_436501 [Trichonephila clavipes]|nr:hypothetical protein TNCV_436501 [Trichonephila clavipes]